jgi:arsenite-transporting ATPase
MPFQNLLRDCPQFLLFGGKGGVGKTTFAAATGLYLAGLGKKTLVFSVDPAHSLSDSFGFEIRNKITHVTDNLYGLEINAEELLEDLKGRYKEAIDEALSQLLRGIDMPFEREIMRDMMDLSPPGLDELMALSKLNDLIKDREYDHIVIDTAAGAHTIRLLELPHLVNEWMERALRLHDKYRLIAPLEKCRSIIEGLKEDVTNIRISLMDPNRTGFVVVTIPEAMGTYVTEDMIEGLKSCGIPCKGIIINYVVPSGVDCEYCISRRKEQMKRIREIYEKFSEYDIIEMPTFPQEVRGTYSLTNFAKVLFEGKHVPNLPSRRTEDIKRTLPTVVKTPRLNFLEKDLRLILFGGKGGCGKTTCSAATGIYMAERGKKTLVLSTDPQCSLSDSFDQKIGGEATLIKDVKNLYAVEVDTERLLEEWKEQHKEALLDIVEAATYLNRQDLYEFLDLSLPGMDELMALVKLVDLMKEGEYDLFILDTAPTGHTLRFLELPDKMSNWVKLLMKMRSKTQYIMRRFFGRSIRERADVFLEETMGEIERIKVTFMRPQTEFIPVTTLEELAIEETERLVATLKSYGIPVKQIVINGLVPPNPGCPYCTSKIETQRKGLKDVYEKFSSYKIIGMPLFPYEVRGIDALKKFAEALFGTNRR